MAREYSLSENNDSLKDSSRDQASSLKEIADIVRSWSPYVMQNSVEVDKKKEEEREKDKDKNEKKETKEGVKEEEQGKEPKKGGILDTLKSVGEWLGAAATKLVTGGTNDSSVPAKELANIPGLKNKKEGELPQGDEIRSPQSDKEDNLKNTFKDIFSSPEVKSTREPTQEDKNSLSDISKTLAEILSQFSKISAPSNSASSSPEIPSPPKIDIPPPASIEKHEGGGYTTASEFIVGEGKGANPNPETAELVKNPTGAPIQVFNTEQLNQQGMNWKGQEVPGFAKGTIDNIPRFDTGSMLSGAASGGGNIQNQGKGIWDGISNVAVDLVSGILGPEVGVFAEILHKLGDVVIDVVRGFQQLADSIAYVSPQIGIAKAEQEVKDIELDIKTNDQMGDQLAELTSVSGDVWRDITELLRNIGEIFLPIIIDVLKAIKGLIELLPGTGSSDADPNSAWYQFKEGLKAGLSFGYFGKSESEIEKEIKKFNRLKEEEMLVSKINQQNKPIEGLSFFGGRSAFTGGI